MDTASVNADDGHQCGTVHCHGGWFAIAAVLHKKGFVTFEHGKKLMSQMLGFRCGYDLKVWGALNPQIWGNPDAMMMFLDVSAFYNDDKRPAGAENLQHIIDHWTEVAERLEALENQVDISDPPITAEELIESLEPETA